MNERLFSLCTPCPDGFTFCREFQVRDFRRSPFALYAPSSESAQKFLGQHLSRLAGVILIPGDHLSSEDLAPLVSQIIVSPSMLPYLADFADHQLVQLERRISSEECRSLLTLENERLELNNQRDSEDFSRFRASLLHEVEERRAAERHLAESEELLRLIMSSTVEAIYGVDTKGLCTFANESCLRLLGYEHIGEVLGRNMHDLIHYQTSDGLPMPVEECLIFKAFQEGNGITVTDECFWRRDGSSFPVEYSSYPIRKDGEIIGAVVTWRDISERRKAETTLIERAEALERSESKFRLLFEHSADPSLLIAGKSFVDCNQAAVDILQACDKKTVLNMHPSTLSPEYQPDGRLSAEKADEMIAIAVRNGSHRFEWMHQRMNGEPFPVEVSLTLIQAAGQAVVFTVWRDITERKRSETLLRESEERYRSLVDNIPLGISLIDKDYRIIMTNKTQAEMFGKPAEWFNGRYCYEEFEKRDETCCHCPGKVCMEEMALSHAYTAGIRDDGSCFDVHIQTVPLVGDGDVPYGFIEVVEDITDRKRAEEERLKLEQQLLHAQKLESLGVLAGGIAHDFNNILMAIIGNADLALMRINRESPAIENLHRIEQAAAQAADLAKQMLAYSGKGRFVVENIDINRLLEEMLHMLEVSISKKAVLRFNLHKPLPPVEADATQMRQIIMNLVINASEAIDDKSGFIAITTGCMDCDQSYLKDVWLDENITEGLYVYLEIADTGCGMDKDTLAKIFDPFFTTKFTGRGLGMAAVLGIVRGHKGAIKVYSEPGKGTSFKILLPASGRPAELFNHVSTHEDWHGSGTVLLVDDEETVRGIGVEMLKELGFNPVTANDGREAVALFKQTPDISFVILDLTMPHMDGEQCFRELRQLKPDIKVIMSSGYNEQEVTQKFVGKGLAGFIQKPYKLSTLREAVRRIMSE